MLTILTEYDLQDKRRVKKATSLCYVFHGREGRALGLSEQELTQQECIQGGTHSGTNCPKSSGRTSKMKSELGDHP
jgi:hypothetical protein